MKTVTVHLTDEAFEALENSAYAEANTHTDVINRALVVYAAIGGAQPGKSLTFNNPNDGPWKTVVTL
jgi:hypothetical protein